MGFKGGLVGGYLAAGGGVLVGLGIWGVGWGTCWGLCVVRRGGMYVGLGVASFAIFFKKSETGCVQEKLERVEKTEQKLNRNRI